MPRAQLISTEGEYLEACIEIEGIRLQVMDAFSPCDENSEINLEFDAMLSEDESWEDIFAGNTEGRIGLEHISGWRYRAFGRIVSIHPVITDCGLLDIQNVIDTNDPRVVGEHIGFTISRLSATCVDPNNPSNNGNFTGVGFSK